MLSKLLILLILANLFSLDLTISERNPKYNLLAPQNVEQSKMKLLKSNIFTKLSSDIKSRLTVATSWSSLEAMCKHVSKENREYDTC